MDVRTDPVIDDPTRALPHAVRCLGRDDAVAALDSLLDLRLLSRGQVRDILSALPARHRVCDDMLDPAAQSGLETHVRLRCRARNIPIRSQVQIEEVGRVDFLIGDRLVIEVDGKEHHSGAVAFADDRRRDLVRTRRPVT